MAKQAAEQFAEASTEVLSKSSEAADKAARDTAAALTENGNASRAAIQELTRAYQELATKNVHDRRDAGAGDGEKPGRVYRHTAAADQGRG